MSKRLFACGVVIAVIAFTLHMVSVVDAKTVVPVINALNAQTGSLGIFASSIVSQDSSGVDNTGTAAFGHTSPKLLGSGGSSTLAPMLMTPDASMRANRMGELLLAIVVQDLVNSEILPQLDSGIPRKLMPRGIQVIHPNFLGRPLTLRQLMLHTSSIIDNDRFKAAEGVSQGASAISDLRTFCEQYFVQQDLTEPIVADDIWEKQNQPGTISSYRPSRANTALLTYIVQQTINERPQLVKGQQKTVGALIQEMILAPLGMTGTYFVLPDGSAPRVQGNLNSFTQKRVAETTSTGVSTTQLPVHPAYVSDYMLMTSASDIAKLMRGLFMEAQGKFVVIGSQLRESLVSLPAEVQYGINRQGFGIQGFNADVICGETEKVYDTSTGGCALISGQDVFGYVAPGTNTVVGGVCTMKPAVEGDVSTLACFSTAHSFNALNNEASPGVAFAAAGSAMNNMFIDSSITLGTTVNVDDQMPGPAYAAGVAFSIVGLVVFVVLVGYFSEYVLHPAAIAGSVASDAYPTLDEHIRRSQSVMR